ncbi:TonB-dependent receptor [Sphingomonas sp.]|jgi:iron complex outermembrane receptor protein|uniref:TonB-dependent receptor n=1 Tax=Sphingomonas sp. TaxID=28214 RepID=UPI002D7FCC84|nr:TonB-dependent receptor [Sphingomonas sp.]HEU0043617.1 TonB-dependent receptor [Sphingomonas sp.]
MKLLLLTSAALLATPVLAQTSEAPLPGNAVSAQPRDVIVTAPVQTSERDVLQGTSVLSGEELARELRPTIGETLQRQAGVSATSFGPSASRPILRGFQGERIRVLTDGIGSIDVSNTSVDHAVIIDPLLAERVEVLRGPSALLFGSSAVGGVVNVIDRRIPRSRPANGYRFDAIANYGSAANERSGAVAGDVAIGRNLVLHANGSYLKADDLRIGGFALSPAARAAALSQVGLPQEVEDGEEPIDFAANAAVRGRLPNTAAETWTAGVGASIITDTGSLGVAYSHYDSLYGIPIRFATEVGQEQEAPRLDVVQDRWDLRADVQTGGGFLERVRARGGYAKYRHFELEPDGAVGTAFFNKGVEGRLELIQAKRGAWLGASGVQYFSREFDVEGEEAFLPRNSTEQTGLFTLQQLDLGGFRAEGGVRYEFSDLQAKNPLDDPRFFNGRRHFEAFSGSLGGSWGSDAFRVGLNGSRTTRAPSAEELFANGAHAGTQSYELGNPDFRVEKSWGLEATVHAHSERFDFDASAYYNRFSNYISENQVDQSVCEAAAAPSGREVDLPCFQYQQGDARYYGVEAELSGRLLTLGSTRIVADVLGDYVHATLVGGGPVPRIPPLRLLGGIEAQGDRFTARAEVERVWAQNRVAQFETRTPGYTLVNLTASVRPFGAENRTTLLVSANNLLDVTARRHSSVLKDFAPLAGRDLRVTLRVGI